MSGMRHLLFTIVADVLPGHEDALRNVLSGGPIDFTKFPDLHFASFVVFDRHKLVPARKGAAVRSKLVFENVIDLTGGIVTTLRDHLKQIVETPPVAPGLGVDAVYTHCDGYDVNATTQAKADYLRAHVLKPSLYHEGTPYRSVESIKRDRKIRDELEQSLQGTMRASLFQDVARAAAGVREYWWWEIAKPWLAWLAVIVTFFLLKSLVARMHWEMYWRWAAKVLAGGGVLVATVAAAVLAIAATKSWAVLTIAAAKSRAQRTPAKKSPATGRAIITTSAWVAAAAGAWVLIVSRPHLRAQWALLFEPSFRDTIVGTLVALIVSVAGLWATLFCWLTSARDMRARVSPWITWAVGGLLLWLVVLRPLSVQHLRWTLAIGGVFLALLLANAAVAIGLRRDARLAAVRPPDRDPSTPQVWTSLRSVILPPAIDETPAPSQRLWNWKAWFVIYVGAWLILRWFGQGWWAVIGLTLVYCAKAIWLTIVVGWPEQQRNKWTYRRAMIFVGGVAAIAFIAMGVLLRWLHWGAPMMALVVPATLVSLWLLPLPSPELEFPKIARDELVKQLEQEDRDVQNHMSAVVPLKEGRYRTNVLRSFLFLLNHIFYRAWLPGLYTGKLFGIPTVHFAQWVLIDDRNFVFLSNYDHSWTSYLDDFGAVLKTGIQKIWGQGVDNPGVERPGLFKDYVRTVMVPYAYWYQAYPGLAVRQINSNEKLRLAIGRRAGEQRMVKTLRRFGAAPKTIPDVVHGTIR